MVPCAVKVIQGYRSYLSADLNVFTVFNNKETVCLYVCNKCVFCCVELHIVKLHIVAPHTHYYPLNNI